jgi:nitrite transporter
VFVTLGNLVGGAIFMSLGYWLQEGGSGHGSDHKHLSVGQRL